MFKFVNRLDKSLCINNPDALIVFGDNLLQRGQAGQACIRYEKNVFGIPTKRLPSTDSRSYFSDKPEEVQIVKEKIQEIWKLHKEGKIIFLPNAMIGSGLARIDEKSPRIFKIIKAFYEKARGTNETLINNR